jgi:hypothetical protein
MYKLIIGIILGFGFHEMISPNPTIIENNLHEKYKIKHEEKDPSRYTNKELQNVFKSDKIPDSSHWSTTDIDRLNTYYLTRVKEVKKYYLYLKACPHPRQEPKKGNPTGGVFNLITNYGIQNEYNNYHYRDDYKKMKDDKEYQLYLYHIKFPSSF